MSRYQRSSTSPPLQVDLINVQPAQGPVDLDFTHKLLGESALLAVCTAPRIMCINACNHMITVCEFLTLKMLRDMPFCYHGKDRNHSLDVEHRLTLLA